MSKSKGSAGNVLLDSGERSNSHKNERPFSVIKRNEDRTLHQNTSTVWKNISKLFNKAKARQKSIDVINVVKEKEFSLHRLSSFFRCKKLSQNSLVPLTTIGESPTGYQAAFTEKTSDTSSEKVTAMTIKLPEGITTDDVIVTVELSIIRPDTTNSDTSTRQEPMTMYCTEENEAQTVFTGVLKVPNETEIMNLLNMPLYLIDSLQNIVLNPGSEISHKKIVRTSKEISCGNPFPEIEVDDIQVKLTFDKMSGGFNNRKMLSAESSDGNDSGSVEDVDESDEMVITVNSYNLSEISSILKGKQIGSDEIKSAKDVFLEDAKIRELVVSQPWVAIEPKEKTEDVPVKSLANESQKLSEHEITITETTKQSVTDLKQFPETPKTEYTKEMSTQYSHSYFTANKETDTQHNFFEECLTPVTEPETQSVSATESIEIKDFTYFGDQKLKEGMVTNDSRSTATPWPSTSNATVTGSATLLSFISDCGFLSKNDLASDKTSNNLQKCDNVDIVITVQENAPLCTTLNEPLPKCFETSEIMRTLSTKDLELKKEDSLLMSLRSDTDVDKEGKAEAFSTIEDLNRMSVKSADKIFEFLEGACRKSKHMIYDGFFEDGDVKSYKSRPEETRKVDIHLGKNPFYFPERELNNKEDGNKRYYEDNDEFYEKHREDIQNFFQDRSLALENFQISKSKKNYDLYLGGDQENKTNTDLKLQCTAEDTERIIAVHDEVDVLNKADGQRTISTFNYEITANFVQDSGASKFPTTATKINSAADNTAKKECSSKDVDSKQCDLKNIIVEHKCQLRDTKSSSSSIMFKIAGGMQLNTNESCNSSFSKKTIVLESCKSTTRICDGNEFNEVIQPVVDPNNTLLESCKEFQKNQNHVLSVSNHEVNTNLGNSAVAQTNEDLRILDQNNKSHRDTHSFITKTNPFISDTSITTSLNPVANQLPNTDGLIKEQGSFNMETDINNLCKSKICQNAMNTGQNIKAITSDETNNVIVNSTEDVKEIKMSTLMKYENAMSLPVEEQAFCNVVRTNSKPLENPKNAQICIPFLYKQFNPSTSIDLASKSKKTDSRINVKINKYSINSGKNNEIHDVPIDMKVNDLKDCLIKMNEILMTATSMSLLKKPNTKSNRTIDPPVVGGAKVNLELSNERQKTYETVENDIKRVIEELLKESKDIKESVILKGAIEEFEPPFIVDYIKQEPIDYTKLCLVMVDEIEKIKQKNKIHEMRTIEEPKLDEFKLKENKLEEEVQTKIKESNEKQVALAKSNLNDNLQEVVHEESKLKNDKLEENIEEESVLIKRKNADIKKPESTLDKTKQEEIAQEVMDIKKIKTSQEIKREGIEEEMLSVINSIVDNVVAGHTHEQTVPEINLGSLELPSNLNYDFDEQNTRYSIKDFPNCSNSFEIKQNSINTQMTHFCNSDMFNSKIPKTCHSFGKIFESLSNNKDELCLSNVPQFPENEKVSYSNNEPPKDHNPQITITGNLESTIALPSHNNPENIVNLTTDNKLKCLVPPNENYKRLESVSKLKTVLSTTYEEDCPPDTPGKGVPKCKKKIELANVNETRDTNDNLPSTSTQYIHHKSTEEEEFLNDIDLTNPIIFSTEEEEEVLLSPKIKESSSRTFIKDTLFTSSSSDEEIYEFQVKMSKVNSLNEARQNQKFNTDQSQVSLQVKPPTFNLHKELEAESSKSIYSISNLKILTAKRGSDASDADDENDNARINFTLPKHRYKSKLELNSPQEVADIERNLQDNEVLTRKNKTILPRKSDLSLNRIASEPVVTSSDSAGSSTEAVIDVKPTEAVDTPQVLL